MFNIGEFMNSEENELYVFLPIKDIVGKPFRIESYRLFTAKDKEKYASGNERGLRLRMLFDNDDTVYQTVTHSKVLVSIFDSIKKKNVAVPEDVYFKILRVEGENGRVYFTIEQVKSD